MKIVTTGLMMLIALSSVPAFAVPTGRPAKKVIRPARTDNRSEMARRQLLADLRLRGSAIPAVLSANGRGGR